MVDEVWLPIHGLEGHYEISNAGRVRILRFVNGHANRAYPEPRIKVLKKNHMGRYFVDLPVYGPDRYKTCAVHRLVLEAFVGPCPPGLETGHLDGDPSNNRVDNLRWITKKENASHRVLHGTARMGERHPHAKLTESDVRAIRVARAAGDTQRAIAASYGISPDNVRAIERRTAWKHVV